jgi:hypothetical protein
MTAPAATRRGYARGEKSMLRGKYRNLHSRTLTIGALLVLAFICSIPAFAQDITSGTIQGTVTDEKGAVIQGAVVEAKNVAHEFFEDIYDGGRRSIYDCLCCRRDAM